MSVLFLPSGSNQIGKVPPLRAALPGLQRLELRASLLDPKRRSDMHQNAPLRQLPCPSSRLDQPKYVRFPRFFLNLQSAPQLQKPRVSDLLRHRARQILPHLQRSGYSRGSDSTPGYQELKHGKMCVSPDGVHVLLIGSEGTLFRVDLRSRRCESVRQLASPVCDASFYDSTTCYILTSFVMGDW